jgi:hypothetical protein
MDLFPFKIETVNGAIIAQLQQVIRIRAYLKTNRYNYTEDRTGETDTRFIRLLLFFALRAGLCRL